MAETHGADADRVIVVGGGIAGLVVARDLARGGRRVLLLEASDRLGGQIARSTIDGIDVDAAAEAFATRGGAVAALAAELGLADDIVTPLDAPAWLHRADGSSVPLPATSVLGIPGVPMAADVIRVVGTRAALRAQLDAILPAPVGANERSLGGLIRRRMGAGVLESLVAPVVRGVHSVHPDDLPVDRAVPGLLAAIRREGSLAHAVRSLRERAPAGSQVAGIRGGLARLVDALVADLGRLGVEVRTGVRVLDADAEGVEVRVVEMQVDEAQAVGAQAVDVDADARATAEHAAPAGLDGRRTESGRVDDGPESTERLEGHVVVAAPMVGAELAEIRPITIVTLVVDAPGLDAAPRGPGALVAAGAPGVAARALTHATAKWGWLREAAAGRHVLRLSYDEPPADASERARRDAEILLGVAIPPPRGARAATWLRASPASGGSASPASGGSGSPVPRSDPPHRVGEAASGTGLAAVVASARELAGRLLGGNEPPEPTP